MQDVHVVRGKVQGLTTNAKPYGGSIFKWGIFAFINGSGYCICGFLDTECKQPIRTQHIVRLHLGLNEVETRNSRYTLDHMDRERAAAVANHSQLCVVM